MATKRPNILIMWGDDIGMWNVSRYSLGMMGYRTPNIDRIGIEGVTFTDYYAQQSCTAGRASFITGQNPIRTGLNEGRNAWRNGRSSCRGRDDRGAAQAARVRDRSVWQKSFGEIATSTYRACTASTNFLATSIT